MYCIIISRDHVFGSPNACVRAGSTRGVENQVLRSNGTVVAVVTVTPAVVGVLLAVRPFNFHTHHCFVIYENVNN